jgi:hypothetical protein
MLQKYIMTECIALSLGHAELLIVQHKFNVFIHCVNTIRRMYDFSLRKNET